ncbi:MAG: type IV pilus assembly protein PilM [Candidatus Komeilibacteria bacterium]|nr:type IV pilus assembly protein PilM [Candidatus Komeilibacteria bacterium]
MEFNFIQNYFGLDISENYLRLVELKKIGAKIYCSAYNSLKMEPGIIADGQFVKKTEAVHLLKKLIQTDQGQKIFTRYAVASLPEPKTFIKVIDIVYAKVQNIVDEVIEESKKHIPYTLDKVYLDWQPLWQGDKTKVIIGVCPKEVVENYQQVLAQAAIMPVVLEIEAMAIARSLFPLRKTLAEPIMVIDLGASRTGLFVYEKDYIPFSLSLKTSSNDLTKCLAAKLKLTADQAEEIKKKIGLDATLADGGLKKVLDRPLSALAEQIKEAKYFYYEHFNSASKIAKVYLTGGGSNLKNLAPFLAEKINLPVERANPLLNLTAGKINLPVSEIQSYTTAIGLALRQYQ